MRLCTVRGLNGIGEVCDVIGVCNGDSKRMSGMDEE